MNLKIWYKFEVKLLPFLALLSVFSSTVALAATQNFVPGNRTQRSLHPIRRVVIDAGHGGHDSGAVASSGTAEKMLALEVARDVTEQLRGQGLKVLMTREDDVFVPLDKRAEMANEWDSDLFVSIHLNASTSPRLGGFEIYMLSENANDENRRQSLLAARDIMREVSLRAPLQAERFRAANFRVLKQAHGPSLLIELGYLTTLRDRERLENPRYRRRLAEGIVQGIWAFKHQQESSLGFSY